MEFEAHTKWAVDQGVILNGIAAHRYPGRGVGIVAEKKLEVGDVVLTVPKSALRTLQTVPKKISKSLSSVSVQSILATQLALDTSEVYNTWRTTVPSKADVELSMPLMWPSALQDLLPPSASQLLKNQERKILADWTHVSPAFPTISYDTYLYNWFIVGTRTFYWTSPDIKSKKPLEHDDCLALLPFADLFNHADTGCSASYSSAGYKFIADREIGKGEEVHISYGNHSNDFLLVEYGFILDDNIWNEVCLDKFMLPLFSKEQQELLKDEGYLGRFVIDPETISYRIEVALRLLCMPPGRWTRLVANGIEQGDQYQQSVNALFTKVVKAALNDVHHTLTLVEKCGDGHSSQRAVLKKRWGQIEMLISSTIQRIERR